MKSTFMLNKFQVCEAFENRYNDVSQSLNVYFEDEDGQLFRGFYSYRLSRHSNLKEKLKLSEENKINAIEKAFDKALRFYAHKQRLKEGKEAGKKSECLDD